MRRLSRSPVAFLMTSKALGLSWFIVPNSSTTASLYSHRGRINWARASLTSSRAVSAHTRDRLNRSPAMMVRCGPCSRAVSTIWAMQARVSRRRRFSPSLVGPARSPRWMSPVCNTLIMVFLLLRVLLGLGPRAVQLRGPVATMPAVRLTGFLIQPLFC